VSAESGTRVPPVIITEDNAFFFEAAAERRLEIQQCAECGRLRHPPTPTCATCRSLEWGVVEASGRARLVSATVIHRPIDPAFEYPLVVGLAELEEGVRIVADMPGVPPESLRDGMPLRVDFATHAHGMLLPVLRDAGAES